MVAWSMPWFDPEVMGGAIDAAMADSGARRRGRLEVSIAMPPPDLRAVDELCNLARAVQRLGCRVRLEGATDELRDLLDLAGVTDLLLDDQPGFEPNGADLR